jgi:hypothetical protein
MSLGYALSGCVVVPPHDGLARVRVDDVVKRIKCDIATAILEKSNERSADGKYPFAFLTTWAAKLHLTVIVDDTAAVNPGATFIRTLPTVKSTSQSFNLGVGAGITTEAVRQEDMEFLISFSDMVKEFSNPKKRELYQGCVFNDGLLLESDLGLADLVDSALKPIESKVLYPGNNIGPGAAPPPAPEKLSPAGELGAITNKVQKRNQFVILGFGLTNEAAEIETRTQNIMNNMVKPLYAIASASSLASACLADVTQKYNKAVILSIGVSEGVIKYDTASSEASRQQALDAVKEDFTGVIDATNKLFDSYSKCAQQVQKNKLKVYDPIDVISETVNFYVTSSGSVTPTWKLINVTAPLAATFASASRKDTNTLILSLGRPVLTPDGGITASQAMNNQILASLLSQALSQRPSQ